MLSDGARIGLGQTNAYWMPKSLSPRNHYTGWFAPAPELVGGVRISQCDQPLMSKSHQTFGLVPAVKLPGIMFKNKCWPTTFHIIITEDAYRWCQNWIWVNQPIHSFLIGCRNPCLQGTNVRVGSPQPQN